MKYTKEILTLDVLRAIVDVFGYDGHSVYDPTHLGRKGIPEAVLAAHTRQFTSNLSSPKSTIFSSGDGHVIDKCTGIHGLDLLHGVAGVLGLPGSSKMGRGFAARELTDQIEEYIEQQEKKHGQENNPC